MAKFYVQCGEIEEITEGRKALFAAVNVFKKVLRKDPNIGVSELTIVSEVGFLDSDDIEEYKTISVSVDGRKKSFTAYNDNAHMKDRIFQTDKILAKVGRKRKEEY